MSNEMILSICKASAYGETAENTAIQHGITADEVQKIWDAHKEIILEYQNFSKEMGCAH